jgi:ubiquinone/menaquinone biosynthesis C-methylase UbiE
MSVEEQAPLYFSGDARLGLGRHSLRRMALIARLGNGSKVLDLGCGSGSASILLAKDFGCSVVAADDDGAALATLASRARSESLSPRVETLKIDFAQLTFADGEFNLVIAPAVSVYSFPEAARKLRRYLAPRGRLLICHPVRVGHQGSSVLAKYWEQKLGGPLQLPRELLQVFEHAGYEPEALEALSEAELVEVYRGLEQKQAKRAKDKQVPGNLAEELELYRAQNGRSSVTFVCAVGRRRAPGEKPPAARERG